MPILAYDAGMDRVTVRVRGSNFPVFASGPDYIPDPIIGSEYNGYIKFTSNEPGFCNVDWGDGSKEQYMFTKIKNSNYILMFRSLNIEWKKNPNQHPWWYYKEDGTEYIPNAFHIYTDGDPDVIRTVVFEFTNKVVGFHTSRITDFYDFPILEVPSMVEFNMQAGSMEVKNIPMDKLEKSSFMTTFVLSEFGLFDKGFPEGILALTNLTSIYAYGTFDLTDSDDANFRKIGTLKKLTSINLQACGISKYIKEFNDIPNLKTLSTGGGDSSFEGYDPDALDMSEVDKINPSIDVFSYLNYWSGPRNKTWLDQLQGKGLENLTSIKATYALFVPVDTLPEYFKEMRSMELFILAQALRSQDRVDSFINSWYDYVVSWNNLTMEQNALDGDRNQFYGMKLELYDAEFPNNSVRPSGTLQAPSGFSQGQSNGTPTTPMEKIYVLTNNYKQVWTLKPEETASGAARALINATPYSLSIVEDRVYFGTGDMVSPGEVFNFQIPEDAKHFLASLNYPIDAIDEYVKQQNEGGPA